jgi:hypothetical protein
MQEQLEKLNEKKGPVYQRAFKQALLWYRLNILVDRLEHFKSRFGVLFEAQQCALEKATELLKVDGLRPSVRNLEKMRGQIFRHELVSAFKNVLGKGQVNLRWLGDKLTEMEKYDLGFLSPSRYRAYIKYTLWFSLVGFVFTGSLSFGAFDNIIKTEGSKQDEIAILVNDAEFELALGRYLRAKGLLEPGRELEKMRAVTLIRQRRERFLQDALRAREAFEKANSNPLQFVSQKDLDELEKHFRKQK